MAKKSPRKARTVSVYTNLAEKRRTKKDRSARKRAEYLASLPKHPLKRTLYRMHPKRVAQYWFSKKGALMALKISGVMILLMVLAVGGIFAYYRKDLEAIRPDQIAARVQTTVSVYKDRNGNVLWEDKGGGNYRLAVKDDEISDYMKKATVAIEDKEFYKHSGISPTGLIRATFSNAQGNSTQGGSTLTQQLVKQVFLAEDADKRGLDGIPRKIKEVILSIEVERMYNKQQILNLYLNESPYGGPRNGVESAAQTYFQKPAKDLTLAESALLAAIPNEPGRYNPYNTLGNDALIERQHKVLSDMVSMGYIAQAEADAAKQVPIISTIKPEADQYKDIKAPHFVLMVKRELEAELGKAVVGRGGLTVTTSLDLRIQEKSEEAMAKMFVPGGKASWAGFSNGALTVEDVKTGQIVALLGSRDFRYPGFGQDNAAIASIQPGSTIKGLVFAALLEDKGQGNQNFGSGSILADDKSMDKIYGAPLKNWDGKYKGALNIRQGLAQSRNVPAIKAMHINGVSPTLEKIREAGDKSYCTVGSEAQVGLASAIGGCGVKQVEHNNAIATLARGGVYKPYSTILEVKNSSGDVLKKYTESSKQVFDPQSTYIISDILSDDNARASLYGRNQYGLVVPGVRTAVKTGTSDIGGNAKDIWNVSYSTALAMSVWLGNSDTSPLRDGNSSIPAPIIGDVMSYAHTEIYAKEGKWTPGDWFTQPDGIQRIGGELYPSWYNRTNAQSTQKMTFDSISKKKATNCTPAEARIDVSVTSYTDPITKQKIISAPGYDVNAEDDVHKCDDAKPTVSVTPSSNGRSITVTYRSGSHSLSSVRVTVNGTEVANIAASSSGSQTVDVPASAASNEYTVAATIQDSVLYTGTASAQWKRGGRG